MSNRGIAAVREKLAKLPRSSEQTIEEVRTIYDKATRAFPLPSDIAREDVSLGGVPAERLTPQPARKDQALIYLHGGGYGTGSPRSHRHLAGDIARRAGVVALVPEYRLAPENPFPAAVDDALAVYRETLTQFAAPRIAIAGDSAGGGLTIAMLLAARDAGLPMPAAAICISPWTDMTASSASYAERAAVDPLVTMDGLVRWRQCYIGDGDRRAPLASPAHADLKGLPPLLIQVGGDEILLDDSRLLADKARAAGIDTVLEVWPQMIHVWHWYFPMLDEGERANAAIAQFMRDRLAA
ncbi:MAG: alpha/beta hydrolase [Alphaproteobacteria bacterium]|nr:alpha/beta hydrolase [Alphaproteobacteria bacterium]MCW5739024.1 alpha/beta hydrolase [Alphaproteobacteria bacterium]